MTLPLKFMCVSQKMEDKRRFVDSIRVALLAVANSRLPASHIFGVVFFYSGYFASDVDSWLDFAVKNQVKLLSLYIWNYSSDRNIVQYTLPQSMFSNSSFTRLDLRNCLMQPQTKVDWPCLKKMTLNGVRLQQRDIKNILSGCPVLDDLFLDVCHEIKRLEIVGRSLKDLAVALDHEGGQGLLEISAPYITSLFLLGSAKCIGARKVVLETLPSLETARIDICDHIKLDWLSEDVMQNTVQLLQNLRLVNALYLSGGSNKVISLMVTKGWRLPQLRVKELHIKVARDMQNINIYGVLAMLESCPYVEKLVLHVTNSEVKRDFIEWGLFKRVHYLQCDLILLKIVQVVDLEVSSNPLRKPTSTLAQTILKRAPILEEIVIVKRPSTSPGQIDIIKNTLLSYSKSSMKASVKFKFVEDDNVYQFVFCGSSTSNH